MTRFLVLGSDGFIGTAVRQVIDRRPMLGTAVRHVRRSPVHGAPEGPDGPVALDLATCRTEAISLMVERCDPDVVINCTGSTVGSDAELRTTNVDVVAKIVDALSTRPEVQLVQIGSAAEYGATVDHRPVKETDPPRPLNAYGRTKLEATRLVLGAVAQERIRGTVLRVFNPVGPGSSERTLVGSAAARFAAAVAADAETAHLGPLSGSRDFIDVRDVASAAVAACTSPFASGALLNVGRGEAVSCRRIVRLVAAAAGFEGRIDEDERGSARSNLVMWQAADIDATCARLSWQPMHTLEEAVAAMWAARPMIAAR